MSYSQGARNRTEEEKVNAIIEELNSFGEDEKRRGGEGSAQPKTPQTETKEKSGGGDWQDPY